MAETLTGKLSFENGKWKIVFFNEKKQKDSTLFCQPGSLSDGFEPKEGQVVEVEFARADPSSQYAAKVRPKGTEWKQPSHGKLSSERQNNFSGKGKTSKSASKKGKQMQITQLGTGVELSPEFHNPYNFVPAPPRDISHPELGDHKPVGHDRFLSDKHSGKLRVKMTVQTPLLLPDTARLEVADQDSGSMKKGHKSYPVRVDADGKPLIEPCAIKGMLRAAYEAVTNSRMGVFKEHDKQLAFRSEATTSQGIEPVRINDKQIDFYSAAWLGKYKGYTRNWNGLDKHKQEVWVKVTWKKHPRKHFTYFEVVDLVNRKNGKPSSDYYEGYVCITNENMKNKHHERVFFKSGSERTSIVLTDEEVKRWKTLIENYHEQHKDELDNPPASLGITKWSRQIYMRNDEEKLKTGTLCYALMENGLIKELVPVMISRRLHEKSPAELLDKSLEPAMLITQLSPADRVFGWVRQGKAQGVSAYRGQLRIGVVECKGIKHNGTYDSNVIETFGDQGNPNTWLPLQILGQPKPQQGRFYVAKNKNGEAQERGLNNEQAGYNKDEKGLRGRKVYPHHASVPSNYWVDDKALKTELDTRQSDLSQEALQSSGKTYFREYIRPKSSDRRDKQNRSIQGWVKPGTEFEFDIHFTNLSEVELGALVWLLSLNDENENKYFHRFGGGKPLGFGSVKLELTDTKISSGEDLKAFYASLDIKPTSSKTADDYKSAFERAIAAAYPGVSFLDAFKVACTGFSDGLPIHYPRARRYEVKNNQVQYITATGQPTTDSAPVPPHPDGLAYEWFVANSKESIKERDQLDILPTSNPGQKEIKPRYTLKDLSKDDGLPILPHKK